MTRPVADVLAVAAVLDAGASEAEASRRTGVPRGTLRYWIRHGLLETAERRRYQPGGAGHDGCPKLDGLPDGWRGMNRVPGGYEYSRYQFSSRSDDIRGIFKAACDRVGIVCKPNNRWNLAVSTRADVAAMDVIVGSKS